MATLEDGISQGLIVLAREYTPTLSVATPRALATSDATAVAVVAALGILESRETVRVEMQRPWWVRRSVPKRIEHLAAFCSGWGSAPSAGRPCSSWLANRLPIT